MKDPPLLALPESVKDAYYGQGSHPDIVERVWDELAKSLPRDCRCLIFGTPVLVHPGSGIIFASAWPREPPRWATRRPPRRGRALPLVTFNDNATVWLNDEEIRAIHFPSGHTDGDAVIWFVESNVVHMGDDFVTYGFPFVDVANGGSVSGLAAGCEQVLGLVPPDAKFIPGHGPISTASDVRAFVQMVRDTRAVVEAEVRQGRTLEQIKSAGVLAKWDALGKGFIKTDQWIETLYADITKKTERVIRS